MPDEEKKEGIDLEASYSDTETADAEADDEAAPGGDSADADAEEAAEASGSDADDVEDALGGLMDIFTDESEQAESDAGLLDEFLEDLTMDQVSEEADRLLEEFRAI